MAGLIAEMMASRVNRTRRHQLIGRDGVPPGKKRLGCGEILDHHRYQKLGQNVHLEQFRTAGRHIGEMKHGLEVFESHFDLPAVPEQVEKVLTRQLWRRIRDQADIARVLERPQIDGFCSMPSAVLADTLSFVGS